MGGRVWGAGSLARALTVAVQERDGASVLASHGTEVLLCSLAPGQGRAKVHSIQSTLHAIIGYPNCPKHSTVRQYS